MRGSTVVKSLRRCAARHKSTEIGEPPRYLVGTNMGKLFRRTNYVMNRTNSVLAFLLLVAQGCGASSDATPAAPGGMSGTGGGGSNATTSAGSAGSGGTETAGAAGTSEGTAGSAGAMSASDAAV